MKSWNDINFGRTQFLFLLNASASPACSFVAGGFRNPVAADAFLINYNCVRLEVEIAGKTAWAGRQAGLPRLKPPEKKNFLPARAGKPACGAGKTEFQRIFMPDQRQTPGRSPVAAGRSARQAALRRPALFSGPGKGAVP